MWEASQWLVPLEQGVHESQLAQLQVTGWADLPSPPGPHLTLSVPVRSEM